MTKFLDAGIQDVSTSISIVSKLIIMSPQDDGDESDTHVEARDRRYTCLKFAVNTLFWSFALSSFLIRRKSVTIKVYPNSKGSQDKLLYRFFHMMRGGLWVKFRKPLEWYSIDLLSHLPIVSNIYLIPLICMKLITMFVNFILLR